MKSYCTGLSLLLLGSLPALGHNELMSQARLWNEGLQWTLEVNIDASVAEIFYRGKTEDPTYRLSMENIGPAWEIYEERAPGLFQVRSGGKALEPVGSEVILRGNHILFRTHYPYHGEEELVLIHCFMDDMQRGHHTLVEVAFPGEEHSRAALFAGEVRSIRFSKGHKPQPLED